MRWRGRLVVSTVALIGAVPVLLLALATTWVGSNLNDIAPRPRPAVLALPAPALPDERNAFFALVGLSAETGRDPATVGQALWHLNLRRAALSQQQRFADKGLADLRQQDEAAVGRRLPPVSGARGDALHASGLEFEERLPFPPHAWADIAPHFSGARQCAQWWRTGAVLAWQQGQMETARALLLVPVGEAAQAAAARRWMASEAASSHAAFDDLAECMDPALAPMQRPMGWAERQLQKVEGWQCRTRLGFMPERNKALTDDFWAGAAADLPLHTEAAALALAAAAQQVPAPERAAWAQRQPLSPALRERLRWDASGQSFTVRTWYEEGGTAPTDSRTAIRFAWPPATRG